MIQVLYTSDSYIIVNKKYDMYINSDDPNEKNTVACHIGCHDSHRSTSAMPLHFVQRLDYSTSGVLCIAKNKTAASEAGKALERRDAKKYYLAVLRGHVGKRLFDVSYPVGSDMTPGNTHKMVAVTDSSVVCGHPRSALTKILVLDTDYYKDEPITYVMMQPTTGRRHQLRVHCHAIGHPILGDFTYSDRSDTEPYRMYLHAHRLVLPLPHEPIDVCCPSGWNPGWSGEEIPSSCRAACDELDQYSSEIKTLDTYILFLCSTLIPDLCYNQKYNGQSFSAFFTHKQNDTK